MAKKHMSQYVFSFGAATIAKLHIVTGRTVQELAAEAFSGYRDAHVDDDTENAWADAAQRAVDLFRDLETAQQASSGGRKTALPPEELLDLFLFFLDKFGKVATTERTEDFLQLLSAYSICTLVGSAPLAPPGWRDARERRTAEPETQLADGPSTERERPKLRVVS